MPLHALVEDVVGAYLEAVDAQAAGLIEGLYLIGSVALGEFRPTPATSTSSRSPRPRRTLPPWPCWSRPTPGSASGGLGPSSTGAT